VVSSERERLVEELAVSLNRHGVAGWTGVMPVALARAIMADLLATRLCDYQDDGVRGDIGGPCRKLRGHEGDHDPFERVTPDSLRATFGLDAVRDLFEAGRATGTVEGWADYTNAPHLVPDREALSDGERDCAIVLKWWQDQFIAVGRRAERAEAALEKFGMHTPFCAYVARGTECDCGFSAAKK
jgi:hypothetical protein